MSGLPEILPEWCRCVEQDLDRLEVKRVRQIISKVTQMR